jgi:DNA-binding HxlR family transcriptional regulator
MDKTQLVNLCARTWSLKALALMASGCPARVAPLASTAGCGRTAMGASVAHLQMLGLLERNPGRGHPLRPEYRLTASGHTVAAWALELDRLLASPAEFLLCRGKWVLPVISTLDPEQRYSDMKRELAPVTDRALSNCLGKLVQQRWVSRLVDGKSAPPTVRYRTFAKGRRLHQHLLLLPSL